MRFLVDNALSPEISEILRSAGHDAVHVRDYSMQASADSDILDRAIREDRIVVSADTDFGTLIALLRLTAPSVVLFRRSYPRRPALQAVLLIENLAALEEPLSRGCLAVIEQNRIHRSTDGRAFVPVGRETAKWQDTELEVESRLLTNPGQRTVGRRFARNAI